MKKSTQPAKTRHQGKGFLALAGEAFHVLGEEIIEGKDKVVEAASDKFASVKKAINRITHKKPVAPGHGAKKTVKRSPGKKIVKKASARVASASKKTVRKAAPAKRKP